MTAQRLVEDEPGWGRGDSLLRPDLPMFWLVLALVAGGLAFEQALLGSVSPRQPGSVSLVLLVWTLYTAPFVAVVVALDLHEPEPPAVLAAAFAWGALVAVPVAVVANTSLGAILDNKLDGVAARWHEALTGPVTEEPLKALGLVVLLTLARRQFTTVLDGLVYGAFIGLGFQVAEDVVDTVNTLRTTLHPSMGTSVRVVVNALEVRGFGLGLWSHAVYSGILGAGVAYVVVRRRSGTGSRWLPWLVLTGAAATALGLHFLWNAPWWQPDTATFDATDMATYTAKGLPGLLLIVALAVAARLREVTWFADALQERPEVTEQEAAALRTWQARRAARREAAGAGGRYARRAVRRLQAEQVRLAVAVATGKPAEVVEEAGQRVQFARAVAERTRSAGQPRVTR